MEVMKLFSFLRNGKNHGSVPTNLLRFTDYLHPIPFHKYRPNGPVMVSIGFPNMLNTANPIATSPNTILTAALTIVDTQRP